MIIVEATMPVMRPIEVDSPAKVVKRRRSRCEHEGDCPHSGKPRCGLEGVFPPGPQARARWRGDLARRARTHGGHDNPAAAIADATVWRNPSDV